MTKMIERYYRLPVSSWSMETVEHVIEALQSEKARILSEGNTEVLFNYDYLHDDSREFFLVGQRPETPEEQARREAKEREQQERITAGTNHHLKEAFKTRTREEVLALWEEAQKDLVNK
jgi:hypothetical protein